MDASDSTYLLNAFIEAIARLTSYALTDREKESVVRGFRHFHTQLERFNSTSSFRRLAIESQKKRQQDHVRCHHEGKTCTQNTVRGALKAFLVGYGIKYGLDIAPQLVSLRAFSRPRLLLRGFSRDTFSFASFLAALIGSYKAILCTMRHLRGSKPGTEYSNALVAGLLSGLVSIKMDRNRSRRNAVTLYMVSRAIQYGTIWLFNRWVAKEQVKEEAIRGKSIRRAHSETDFQDTHKAGLTMTTTTTREETKPNGSNVPEKGQQDRMGILYRHVVRSIRHHTPTALMSMSVAVIVFVLVFETDILPRGYMTFLAKASGYQRFYHGKEVSALKTIAQEVRSTKYEPSQMHMRGRIPYGATTKQHVLGFPLAQDIVGAMDDNTRHNYLSCGIFHPDTPSCSRGVLSTIRHSFPIALKVYAPLNLAVMLLFKRGKLFRDPRAALVSLVKASIRSSIFFALLVLGIINGSCAMRALLGRETMFGYVVSGLAGGLAVLVEAPSRRVELAMYCFLRALENGWDVGVKHRLWKNIRHGEVVLFSAAMSVIMTIYQNDPTTIGLTYHSILTRVFGKN